MGFASSAPGCDFAVIENSVVAANRVDTLRRSSGAFVGIVTLCKATRRRDRSISGKIDRTQKLSGLSMMSAVDRSVRFSEFAEF